MLVCLKDVVLVTAVDAASNEPAVDGQHQSGRTSPEPNGRQVEVLMALQCGTDFDAFAVVCCDSLTRPFGMADSFMR